MILGAEAIWRKTGFHFLLVANSWLARDQTQNLIPLLLIANSGLARDQTQNRIPLLLIALGC